MDVSWMTLETLLLSCITILVISIMAVVLHHYQKFNYFKKSGIPHDRPLPIFGNMFPALIRRKHVCQLIRDIYMRNPDAKYLGFFDFSEPVIVLRDPELIRSIAIKNFDSFTDHRDFFAEEVDDIFCKSLVSLKGEKWSETRNILCPSFTGSKMKIMFSLINDYVEKVVEKLNVDEDLDCRDVFGKVTTDVIASCAFGVSLDSFAEPDNDFIKFGQSLTQPSAIKLVKILFLTRVFPTLGKQLGLDLLDPKLVDNFRTILSVSMESRRKGKVIRPDMLQLMMQAEEKISVDEMLSNSLIFFFAGYEPTSLLMSFVAVELAAKPSVQDNLLEEIDQVLEQTTGTITYETLKSMNYLDAVLHETLRKYPVSLIFDRKCTKPFELSPALPGLEKYLVKPGDTLWFATAGIHYDPQYYPDPETFDPTRFLDQKKKNDPTFMAFGLGPRSCLGNRFALMECKILLIQLMKKFKLEISERMVIPFEVDNEALALSLKGGFWIKLKDRKENQVNEE